MKPEDGYLDRLQPLEAIPSLLERKSRFAYDPKTNKTLGVTVVNIFIWFSFLLFDIKKM